MFSASKTVEYVRIDISDILQSPLAFEKLTMQRFWKVKECLNSYLEYKWSLSV